MKLSAMAMVFMTSVILLVITIMVVINVSFSWVFYLTCIGQLFVIFMVYKVLRDKYTTTKTFKDFYEDHSINNYH